MIHTNLHRVMVSEGKSSQADLLCSGTSSLSLFLSLCVAVSLPPRLRRLFLFQSAEIRSSISGAVQPRSSVPRALASGR